MMMMMMMKRPLPQSTMRSTPSFTTLASLLLLLPCSTSAAGENAIIQEGARKKPEHEHCPALLTKALDADANGSGGLDRDEYAQFWNTLTGTDDTTEELSQSLSGAYDTLLCECHETFGYDESCCDDTATFDDDTPDDKGPGAKEEEAFESWTEISLAEFETTDFKDEKPGWMYKHYQKEFCKMIVKSAKNEGIEIDYESLVSSGEIETGTNGTTVASDSTATSTTATPASDEGGDSNTTSNSTLSTTTTESFWESTNSTATTKAEEVSIEDPRETTTIATPEIVDSASTSSTLPATTIEPTTTSTKTSTTTPATTAAAATSNGPITITFLGSTNGNVDAETVNLDEVSHAFWKVSLDLLEEMDVVDDSDRKTRRTQRKLILAFARQIAEYFDSVVMDVEDIDCPSGLAYAIEGTPCLQFIYTLTPITEGALSDEAVAGQFATSFYDATNINGKLYDELYDEYPDTEIVGLGSPGKGIEVDEDDPDASIQADTQIVGLEANTKEVATSGFPVGGIIGVALAAALVVLLVLAVVIKKRRKSRRQELDDSNLSEDMDANEVNADAEWFDGEHDEEHDRQRGMENTPGSSLAALGVASTVATRLSTGDTEVMVVEKQSWTKNEPRV